MYQDSAYMVAASKVLMLKPVTTVVEGVETTIAPATAEEKAQRRTSKINAITYKTGLESVEARLLVYKKNESVYEEDIKLLKCEIYLKEVAIAELKRKLELAHKQKDEIQLIVENFENSSKSLNKLFDYQIVDKCKTGLGYNVVPPPYIGNFLPPKPDLSGLQEFTNEFIVSEPTVKKPEFESSEAKASADKTKIVRKNFGPPLIEDCISDSEDEAESKSKKESVKPDFAKIEFVKSKEQVKSPRKTTVKQVEKPKQHTHRPRDNQRNWNNMMSQRLRSNFKMYNKACYVCGSFNHLQNDCHYHRQQFKNQKMVKPVWNYNQRVNHKVFAKKTHPHAKRNMAPKAILLMSRIVNTARQNFSKTSVLVNTARQVSTAHPKSIVNVVRPKSHFSNTAHSSVKRLIHKKTTFTNRNVPQKVNTIRSKTVNTARPKAVVNAVLGNRVNVVKASACWV
nr:ribonuclease H-like domain-containing protein [Tanacetum cinerariifolium]